jgi:hypothetical protein
MLRPVSQATGIFHTYSPVRKGVGRYYGRVDTEMSEYLRKAERLVRPPPSRGSDALDQFNDPHLRLRVSVDVPLRGPEVGVPRQYLHVPKRAADR